MPRIDTRDVNSVGYCTRCKAWMPVFFNWNDDDSPHSGEWECLKCKHSVNEKTVRDGKV